MALSGEQHELRPPTFIMADRAVHEFGALQDEWEFACLLAHVRAVGVRTMVEIGSYTGGSLWAWRQVVPNVIGVTIGDSQSFHSHGARMIYGDSRERETQDRLRLLLGLTPVEFVFIDGGHDYETCLSDFRWAQRLVKIGLIGIHDINLYLRTSDPDYTGPRKVWDEVSPNIPSYEIANVNAEDPGVGLFFIK